MVRKGLSWRQVCLLLDLFYQTRTSMDQAFKQMRRRAALSSFLQHAKFIIAVAVGIFLLVQCKTIQYSTIQCNAMQSLALNFEWIDQVELHSAQERMAGQETNERT